MIDVSKHEYEEALDRLLHCRDFRELTQARSLDYFVFVSVVADASRGADSPNHLILKAFCSQRGIHEGYLAEQARSALDQFRSQGPQTDYYEMLGVDPWATPDEIRAVWIAQVQESHPDKMGPEGLERTKRLNEAYAVLSSPRKRVEYDGEYINAQPVRVAELPSGSPMYPRLALLVLVLVVMAGVVFFLAYSGSEVDDLYTDQGLVENPRSMSGQGEARVPAPRPVVMESGEQPETVPGLTEPPEDEPGGGEAAQPGTAAALRTDTGEAPAAALEGDASSPGSDVLPVPSVPPTFDSLDDGGEEVAEPVAAQVIPMPHVTAEPPTAESQPEPRPKAGAEPRAKPQPEPKTAPVSGKPLVLTSVNTELEEEFAALEKDKDRNARTSIVGFVSDYVTAYKSRDLARFSSYFEAGARENGVLWSEGAADYGKNFRELEILAYEVKVKATKLSGPKASLDADFIMTYRGVGEGALIRSYGTLSMRLVQSGQDWKIKELDYVVKSQEMVQ